MKIKWKGDTKDLERALLSYLDIRKNLDPKTEVKRRAKNVLMRIVRTYKKQAPKPSQIEALKELKGLKIRGGILKKKLGYAKSRRAELNARKQAIKGTAGGWMNAANGLNYKPKGIEPRNKRISLKGSITTKNSMFKNYVEMRNDMPAAMYVAEVTNAIDDALAKEFNDIQVYLDRKMKQAARKSGLKYK